MSDDDDFLRKTMSSLFGISVKDDDVVRTARTMSRMLGISEQPTMEPTCYEDIKDLAVHLRRRLPTLIVMNDGTDPWFAGLESRREKAEWFADLWNNRFKIQSKIHTRAIHYKLISQNTPVLMPNGEPYENTVRCQAMLNDAVRDARYLNLIQANLVIDRRNPAPRINFEPEEDTEAEVHIFSGEIEQAEFGTDYKAPSFSLPSLGITAPKVGPRYHLEIWIEKSTMNDIVLPVGREYGVNVCTFSGECSLTSCEDLIQRAIEHGKPVRIFYISDFDPRGDTMPVSAARKMDFIARESGEDLDIRVLPVALTAQQCSEYKLPRTPIKSTEAMAADFEERYGEGATELDALEALHPGVLHDILVASIETYIDNDIDDAIEEMVQEVNDALDMVETDVTERFKERTTALEKQQEAITSIFKQAHDPAKAAYDEACSKARDTFDEAIEHLREQITEMEDKFVKQAEAVIAEMKSAMEEEGPDADEFEWPEPAEADEDSDPLYDSTRQYLKQVERFRRHKGKQHQRTTCKPLYQLICEVCGGSFTSVASKAKACGHRCLQRRDRLGKKSAATAACPGAATPHHNGITEPNAGGAGT
jgi:hypothetical protein